MADLSITAASVAPVSGPTGTSIAGVSITPGQALYIDANGKAQLAKNDTAVHAAFAGIALDTAGSGQPVTYAKPGARLTIGATVVAGACYSVSSNAGGIQPEADFMTGYFVSQIGRAITTTDIVIDGTNYGYAHG